MNGDLVMVRLDSAVGERWRECADVLYCGRPYPLATATLLTGLVLRRYPGCALAWVPGAGGGGAVGVRRAGVSPAGAVVLAVAGRPSR
ncbi:hypothetical protein [Streptomyces sp. NPDC004270]